MLARQYFSAVLRVRIVSAFSIHTGGRPHKKKTFAWISGGLEAFADADGLVLRLAEDFRLLDSRLHVVEAFFSPFRASR